LAFEADLPVVVLVEVVLVSDLGELLLLEQREQIPGALQGPEDVSLLILALS
jgi:hypothetical protein